MPKNPKQTSEKVAKVASSQLRNKNTGEKAKQTAASALSQAPLKKKQAKR
jgi:hypothetical protein